MNLLDISGDALRAVLLHLDPKDLCRCKSICHKLEALSSEDSLWEAQCLRWFQRHGKQSGLCHVPPAKLKTQLLHSSFDGLYQVLHALNGWPEGLWYRTDPAGQPHGALVWIHLNGCTLHVLRLNHIAEKTAAFCQILLDTTPVQIVIGAVDGCRVTLPASSLRINSSAGTMVVSLPFDDPDSHPATWLNADGSQATINSPSSMHQWQTLFHAWNNEDEPLPAGPHPLRLHRVAPLPPALPSSKAPLMPELQPGFSAAQALQRLSGLWTACYGGHGPEILHVWFDDTLQSQAGAPVLEGTNSRPRLVGCKVTGDPNVPANQWSFVAQAGEMKVGRWDGRGNWSNSPEETQYRPIVKFHGLPMLVDMRERQVAARFLCHGCINHTPGNFKPEWVPAQLLLYDGPKVIFSVLFDDRQERFRHIMDFEPVPLPCRPSLSWLQDRS